MVAGVQAAVNIPSQDIFFFFFFLSFSRQVVNLGIVALAPGLAQLQSTLCRVLTRTVTTSYVGISK